MCINPAPLRDYVALAKDIVTGLSAVTAATVAVIGLKTWARQLRGKTEYDLARRLLTQIYRVRQRIQALRHPFVSSGETIQALQGVGADIEEFDPLDTGDQARAQRAVYQRRWERLQEPLAELRVEAIEAKVLWGDVVDKRLQPLYDCVSDLFAAINSYLRRLDSTDRAQRSSRDLERLKEVNDILYDSGDGDAYTDRLDSVVDGLVDLVGHTSSCSF